MNTCDNNPLLQSDSPAPYRLLIVEEDDFQIRLLTGVFKSLGFSNVSAQPSLKEIDLNDLRGEWEIALINASIVHRDRGFPLDETSELSGRYLVMTKNSVVLNEDICANHVVYDAVRLVEVIPWAFQYNDVKALAALFPQRASCPRC
ncbi:hypothetical protein D3871_28355 [Noviherbaspirillum saxi]|uniref:Uncharacterized protein n=2 Tax=Noviherbaspirillum saxi TaxID=2320863 RepID=A0A3A3G364_9BURK|nr:hypothetical protein D3871_28355 [Noviherbaspirillum saxi]